MTEFKVKSEGSKSSESWVWSFKHKIKTIGWPLVSLVLTLNILKKLTLEPAEPFA